MYELVQVSEHCYYVSCPSKIGIVKTGENEVCLIDSGNDKDTAKKVKRILDAQGWSLRAIYNTHSHGDHIGGNRYLREQTGCVVYAPEVECAMTRHTILEPAYLYGAYPPKALRSKFLLAEESPAEYLSESVLPEGWSIIELQGHFFSMVGFMTPDGVAYIADCLSGEATLKKYGIGVIYDVKAYIETLEALKNMKAKLFIPSHAEPTEDIEELADYNIRKVKEVISRIEEICTESLGFEEILKRLFDKYSLTLSFEQYALVGSTVRSYLAYLKDEERLGIRIENNRLLWIKTN